MKPIGEQEGGRPGHEDLDSHRFATDTGTASGQLTERAITGFHIDKFGDWVAELVCGHNQHVRHQPPFQLRPWVLEADGRAGHLGSLLTCPLCDRAELPDGLRFVRSSVVWDEHTMPRGLRRAHRIAGGTWGRIAVHNGRLRFRALTAPPLMVVIDSDMVQAVPPDIEHEVEPLGPVRFSIDFLVVDRRTVLPRTHRSAAIEQGGDPACWAHLVSEESGAMTDTETFRDARMDGNEG